MKSRYICETPMFFRMQNQTKPSKMKIIPVSVGNVYLSVFKNEKKAEGSLATMLLYRHSGCDPHRLGTITSVIGRQRDRLPPCAWAVGLVAVRHSAARPSYCDPRGWGSSPSVIGRLRGRSTSCLDWVSGSQASILETSTLFN